MKYMECEIYIVDFKLGVVIDCHCMEDDYSNNMPSHALVTGAEPFTWSKKAQVIYPFRTPRSNACLL